MKFQFGRIIDILAGQLKLYNAVLIGIIALIFIHHINTRSGYFEHHTIASQNVAVKCIARFHLDLKASNGTIGFHRIALMAHRILCCIQVLQTVHQLLLIVFRCEVAKCAFEHAFFRDCTTLHQANNAIAVDNNRTGIGGHLHSSIPCRIHLNHREGIAVIGLEIRHIICIFIRIGIHCNDFNFITVELIRLLKMRELLFAGTAAHIPEVQHDRFFIL